MARAQKTSFNVASVPVAKYGSAYTHQKAEHRATLKYIHAERTHLNERWDKEHQANGHPKTLKNYLSDTKKVVKAKTGRAMQKRAEDKVIGEAVVVVDEETTMEDLRKLGQAMEERFGWTCVQIHLHKDEGYLGKRAEEMKYREGKYNLHAHMFFITTNLETGKSWKMKPGDGSIMQDITAETLNLSRGVRKSERKEAVKETQHVMEFKQDQAEKNLQAVEKEAETIGKEVQEALEVVEASKNARKELKEAERGKSTAKMEEAEIRQNIEELEGYLKPSLNRQEKKYEELVQENTERGWLGKSVNYQAVAEELQSQIKRGTASVIQTDFLRVKDYKRKAEEAEKRMKRAEDKYEKLESAMFQTLGDGFRRFWEDVKRVSQNLLMALGLWRDEVWNNSQETEFYKADKERCLLLINGKTIDERESEFKAQARKVGEIAQKTMGKEWTTFRFSKMMKEPDYQERVRELEDILRVATKGHSRGMRR